ncbi:MAG: serine hydrolase [Sediminibacterium sp.]|nr:serine hydrolase [Sediminibacterium sp.]
MRKFILSLLALSVFASYAQKKNAITKPDKFSGLDTAFERVLKTWHGAGFAVAVVEKDKIVFAKGFGYKDYEKKIPVTPNTLFAIGSCTKAFTSATLGLLQADNKVNFDKPVREYLPTLQFYNEQMNAKIIVRDLMSHRTGLPRHDYSWYGFPSSSRDSLMKRIQYQEPSFDIRAKWQYNNFMFLLQGMIAEKITGKSWEENVREKIFKPLGMNKTNFSIKDLAKDADASLGYDVKKDSIIKKIDYYNIDAMGPAGSINSSVNEMANWVITWINGGKFKGTQVIPAAYVTEAMSSQMVIGAALPSKEKPDVHFSNYGFGWFLASYKGHYRVEHGGNINGFSASTCFFPTDSIGIIVLTNQNGSPIPSIVRNIITDRVLNLPYFDWNSDLKKTSDSAKAKAKLAEATSSGNRKMNTSPSHVLAAYEGIYTHPGYGSFDISLKNDSLFARIGKDILWLKHYHYDVFQPFDKDPEEGIDTTNKSPLQIQFIADLSGDIHELLIALEPTLAPLKFTKTPKAKPLKKEDLQKYVGEYDLGGVIAKVFIKGENTLVVLVPGQPEYELIPVEKDRFSLKIPVSGYFVQFSVNDKGETSELTFQQPNGNFKAKKKS